MSIEKTLLAAAKKMCGTMDGGKYKHIALGLRVLGYVSEAFARSHYPIVADGGGPEDREKSIWPKTILIRRLLNTHPKASCPVTPIGQRYWMVSFRHSPRAKKLSPFFFLDRR